MEASGGQDDGKTMRKRKAIIVDIDGTLAKMCDRTPFEYNKAINDEVHPHIVKIIEMFEDKHFILLVTGRDEECKDVTENWLIKKGVPFDDLFMRPKGNREQDSIIKQRIYEEKIQGKYEVVFALEDRDQVVKMWRGIGLPCLQVAEGNF